MKLMFLLKLYFGWARSGSTYFQAHLKLLLFFADRRLYFLSVTILHPSPKKKFCTKNCTSLAFKVPLHSQSLLFYRTH